MLFGILLVAIMGLLTFVLWNALMPAIFGLPPIGFWQALGLLLLSRVLFGRFGPRFNKSRFARGWKSLTPDERVRFRQAMGSHRAAKCGAGFDAKFDEGEAR
jgi:hypothetical protein